MTTRTLETTTGTALQARRLTANIGAEVVGLDLSRPLEETAVSAIRALLDEHKAVLFRDSGAADEESQARFAAAFGPLTAAHPTVASRTGKREVLEVDSEESVANAWHTDVTFVVNPPQLSILRPVTLPPYGGQTLVANTASALRSLPEQLQVLAETLWALHTNASDYIRPQHRQDLDSSSYREEFESTVFETVHPVVRVHPRTGEKGLFIGAFAQRLKILGVSAYESMDLLRTFQTHVQRPEHQVTVDWRPGDLLLFDNRITQHYAVDNYDRGVNPRLMRRITVGGDIPVDVKGRPSQSLRGDASSYSPVVEG